jgi:acyl carrier protein
VGLDTVEIVMRTEEVFSIDLPDEECGMISSVGDLYSLVLEKLSITATAQDRAATASSGRNRLPDRFPDLEPWTAPDVWATLTAIIRDQLQVDYEEITENATFSDDLCCD